MNKESKILFLSPALVLMAIAMSGCKAEEKTTNLIRILNSEDYIYLYEEDDWEEDAGLGEADLMDQFCDYMEEKTGEKYDYVYDTFDTNESMFNELKTGKTTYDIIVPSDYMIQRLLDPNGDGDESDSMLEEFNDGSRVDDIESIPSFFYNKCLELDIQNYFIPYMWGTVGVLYNPDYYTDLNGEDYDVEEALRSWDALYSEEMAGTFFIKDSMRDTYVVGIMHAYKDEIRTLKAKWDNGEITAEKYNEELTQIFNRCDGSAYEKGTTINLVKDDLLKLKDNAFGFEVDSGKTDMTTGKVGGCLAWSGDAVWSIEEAEDMDLRFAIPEDGSNIWIDGFAIPKGGNVELAEEFCKFISMPANAYQNTWYVGYTPCVGGIEMLEYMYDCYDARGVDGLEDPNAYPEDVDSSELVDYDLSYIFEDDTITKEMATLKVYPEDIGGQLTAQYPSEEMLPNLAVMKDFKKQNEAVLDMWEIIRNNSLPVWAIVLFSVEIAAAIGLIAFFILKKVNKKKLIKNRRALRQAN